MATQLYEYDCEECGETVVVKHKPNQEDDQPLWCPDCSAVEVDYTVDPEDFDDSTITSL